MIVLDAAGVLWWAGVDVENADELLPNGEAAWAWGRIDGDGATVEGDWMPRSVALAAVADVLLDDERRAEDDYERRLYGDR